MNEWRRGRMVGKREIKRARTKRAKQKRRER